MKPDTYDEVIAQRDAARAEVERLRGVNESLALHEAAARQHQATAEAEVQRFRRYNAAYRGKGLADPAVAAVVDELAALRAAFVTTERAANQHEAEVERRLEAIQRVLDNGDWMCSDDIDTLVAALDTPAREGGET